MIKGLSDEKHSKWDKEDYYCNETSRSSARRMPIGTIINEKFKLIDKVIKPINTCPFCGSNNTFHKRVKGLVDNVYEDRRIKNDTGMAYLKFDLCLDCSHKFLIEMFLFEKERNYLKGEKNERRKKYTYTQLRKAFKKCNAHGYCWWFNRDLDNKLVCWGELKKELLGEKE